MADAPGVELLRKSWEIEDHWVLRRDFMIAHKDKFPPDRLLCLAQIFVNIETLGVQYDEDIMSENERLSEEVPSLAEFRRKKLQLQSEERFKAPPRPAKHNRNDLGTRNMTHDRYQSYQQSYSQGRQDHNQYQQTHGYGKAQHQPVPRMTHGQGYNAQPMPQRYANSLPYQQQRSYPQQQQYQPQYQTPAYGRYAAAPAAPQQQSNQYAGYGQRQEYGSRGGRGQSRGSGNSYQNLLPRSQRR